MPNLKWRELSTADFKALRKERMVAVLPLGSTEQHGAHMPVATDALMIEAVVGEVMTQLKGVDCIFLPTLWCTKSGEHKDFPGTVCLSAETLLHVLEEISASVARAGFRKLIYLNAHGGNSDLLAVAARDVHQQTGLTTFVVDIMRLLAAYPPDDLEPGAFDIHAGQFETSVIMARHPKLMEAATGRATAAISSAAGWRRLSKVSSCCARGATPSPSAGSPATSRTMA